MSAILSVEAVSILAYRLPVELAQQAQTGIPWWFWALMAVTLVLLVWMLFNRPKEEDREEKTDQAQSNPVREPVTRSSSPFEMDDEIDFGPFAVKTEDSPAPAAPPSPFVVELDEEIQAQPEFAASYVKPDDLTIIEGIGPKIAKILAGADIHTYKQLAAADTDRLLVALASAGIFMTDPSTWPDQARLAAEGHWDELKKLQEALRGGKTVV